MGTVADVNYGFKGQVTSAQTPLVLGIGARYAVVGSGLKASAGGAGDRAVTVSPGSAWGDGVLSTWSGPGSAVVNAAANSTGSTRWDTLVIRRHWQPASSPTGTSTLMLLTGGSSKAIAVSRKTDRGVTDSDQPIALVPIANGSAVAGTPVDLRCWVGTGGGLVAGSVEALQYLDDIGSVVRVGSDEWVRRLDASGTPELVNLTPHTLDVHDSAVTDAWIKAGEVTVPTNSNGDFSIVFSTPYPTALYAAQMQESGPLTAASISLRWTSEASSKSRITGRAYRSATNAIIPNSAVRVSYVAVGR